MNHTRQARYRRRRRAGLRVYRVELDEAAVETWLMLEGFLSHDADQPEQVRAALEASGAAASTPLRVTNSISARRYSRPAVVGVPK